MNHTSLFTVKTYKDFIKTLLDGPRAERGAQKKLAELMGCQASYLSQVLKDSKKDLNRDQLASLAKGLKLTELESIYLLHLYDLSRCTNEFHEHLIRKQMREILKKNQDLSHQLSAEPSDTDDEAVIAEYYSSWIYGAIHMAVALPDLLSVDAIAHHLGIEPTVTLSVIQFLLKNRLIEEKPKAGWSLTKAALHLTKTSPHHLQNVTQWRIKSLHHLQIRKKQKSASIQTSFCFSLSKADYQKFHIALLEMVKKMHQTIQKSPSEKLAVMNLDLFEL